MAFESLSDRLNSILKKLTGGGRVTEADVKAAMREVRIALLEADVNYAVAKDFVAKVSAKAVGENVLESLTGGQQVIKIVRDEITALLGQERVKIAVSDAPPTIIMMMGLQGAGKTTTAAKLAMLLKGDRKRPLLVACDIYRPAAIKQLQIVGEQAHVPVFEMGTDTKPLKIVQEALKYAKSNQIDTVIIDTAGRLHVDDDMMAELQEINERFTPHEKLLVVDTMTGQDAVNIAKTFNEQIGIDGVIMTKMDGDTRGGAALSVKAVTGKPIKYICTGEKLSGIQAFYPDRMASRILGMGDVMSLIEKAEKTVDEQKARELSEKLIKQKFNLNDFLEQMEQVSKLGSIDDILGMLPGMNSKQLAGASIDEKQMARTRAIIQSMTMKERENPSLLNYSRKRRIAAGCGQEVSEINKLLRSFEDMQKMMKQFSGGKKRFGKMGRGFHF
ncbi:MAG: signal recognition particle protein [Clostridiales bacterium]|nr:signal recognition particle protein [Clostridiales bacterium]